MARPSGNDDSLLHFRSSFHRTCESARVRFIDSPPVVSTTGNETSSSRMHPRSTNQSRIPIPDRRAPCIYWLSNSSIRTPVRLMNSRYFKFSQDIFPDVVYLTTIAPSTDQDWNTQRMRADRHWISDCIFFLYFFSLFFNNFLSETRGRQKRRNGLRTWLYGLYGVCGVRGGSVPLSLNSTLFRVWLMIFFQ